MALAQAGISALVIVGFQPIYLPDYGLIGVEASGVVCSTTLPRLWIVAVWAGLNCLYDATVLSFVLYALSRPKLAGSTPFISALKTSQAGYMAVTVSVYLTATVLFAVKLVYGAYFLPFIPALVCIAVQRVILADSPTNYQHLSLSVGSSNGSPGKGRHVRYRGQSDASSAEGGIPSIRNNGFQVTHHQPPDSLDLFHEAHALSRLEGKHLHAHSDEPERNTLQRAATTESRNSRKLSARSDSLSRLKWFGARSATERPLGPLRPVSQVSAQISFDAEKAGAANRDAWDNEEAWYRDHILLERPSLRVMNSKPTPPPSEKRTTHPFSGEASRTNTLPLFNSRSSLQSLSRYPTFSPDVTSQQQDDVWSQHHQPRTTAHHASWPATASDFSGNSRALSFASQTAADGADPQERGPLRISAIRAQLAKNAGEADSSDQTGEIPLVRIGKPLVSKRLSETILPGQIPWLLSEDGGKPATVDGAHVHAGAGSECREFENTETLACDEDDDGGRSERLARKDKQRGAEQRTHADKTRGRLDDVSASPTHRSVERAHHARVPQPMRPQARSRQRTQFNASQSAPATDQASGETSARVDGIYMTQETVTMVG